jgi:hypothetical protein
MAAKTSLKGRFWHYKISFLSFTLLPLIFYNLDYIVSPNEKFFLAMIIF